ncbi:Crp/Fnr family transcriptional regulator [Flavobacterium hydatis]|nr:Crp/Fnr family transcriptional regulator [Flavobacterium hydatis]
MNCIITNLSQFLDTNEEDSVAFKKILKLRVIKKNEHLLVEGDVCNYGVFIAQGCLRYYYLLDGVESTGNFFFENDWYTDFDSFLYGNPSQQNIEALEDCVLYLVYKQDFDKLAEERPIFNLFLRQMMERSIKGLTGRNKAMTLLSHEERYLQFIKYCPKVMERVSLKYIATYLGVKPESLSRIRTRVSLSGKS